MSRYILEISLKVVNFGHIWRKLFSNAFMCIWFIKKDEGILVICSC